MTRHTSRREAAAALVLLPLVLLLAAGCGGGSGDDDSAERSDAVAAWSKDPSAPTWKRVEREARGQEVRWWLYGGDSRINAYIDEHVVPAAKRRGVTLERVPIEDTATAVSKVVSERRAGKRDGGAVDLIWINGENFASGKEQGIWLGERWAQRLPNARAHVDWDDPSINRDLQVEVDGQESPWSRAALVWAHDTKRTPTPPASLDELLAYAKAHPGRVTYPAPPDFTGSAFVRYVVTQLGEDEAFDYLEQLQPHMWRRGTAFPKNEAELTRLFGDGEVDLALSFDPAFVEGGVRSGALPKTSRPYVPDSGTLTNVSYVTIPDNAAHRAAAVVVADLLLDPKLQAIKADPMILGVPSVLKQGSLEAEDAPTSPYLLADLGKPVPELEAAAVEPLERRWKERLTS